MKIKYTNRKPYMGLWKYKHPITGELIESVTWRILLKDVADYNRANGYPIGLDFESEVERNVCVQQPDECEDDSFSKPRPHRVTMSQVVRGTRFLGSLLTDAILGKESPFVTQEEANRRAEMCSRCSLKTDFKKPCSGLCASLKEVISLTTKGKSTPHDEETASCGICSCWNRVQVHFRLDLLDKGLNDIQRNQYDSLTPEQCWKHTR